MIKTKRDPGKLRVGNRYFQLHKHEPKWVVTKRLSDLASEGYWQATVLVDGTPREVRSVYERGPWEFVTD